MKRMDSIQIQVQAKSKELDYRGINYYVNKDKFVSALALSTDEEYKIIVERLEKGEPDSLRIFCKAILSKELDDKTIADLRIIASGLHIPSYSKYHKDMLLLKIKERINDKGKSNNT